MAKGRTKVARVEAILAPDVRRDRGDVVLTTRAVLDERGKVVGRVTGDVVQNWLSRHFKRREINERQRRAGERLQLDAECSQISIKSLLDPTHVGGGGADVALHYRGARAVGATIRLRNALYALGPCQWVVVAVAVQGQSAASWARKNGRPEKDGIAALRLGLDALADHYHLDH